MGHFLGSILKAILHSLLSLEQVAGCLTGVCLKRAVHGAAGHGLVEIDEVAVKVGAVHAGKLGLAAHGQAAAAAHAGAVDHNGVHGNDALQAVLLAGLDHKLHHDQRADGDDQIVLVAGGHQLVQCSGNNTLGAIAAVVGHNAQFVAAGFELVLKDQQVLIAEARNSYNKNDFEVKVDGNVYAFMKRASRYYFNGDFYPRPTMVYVEHCNHISFHDVTLQNSPFWTLHPAGCNDVLISNIRVLNPLDCTNSDGIDPDHSTNVRIIGCHVQCADDCICLKTTAGNNEYGPTKNVIISNCTLTSTSAAIKIGTEGVADFENILVDNCIITGSNRGLSIQIRDGGCVRNVSFSNIMIETRRFAECWWGCAEPIVMTTHDRNANTHSGSIENVRFFNVTCKGENGVFLSGNEENHIKNVLFENVNVCLEATSKWERGMYDLRPIPPEKEGMLHQKSAAMFLRWVDGVTVRNSTLGFAGEDRSDFAQALLTQNCTNVQTMGLTAEAAAPEYQSIELG